MGATGGTADLFAPGNWALYRNFWAGAEVLTAWSMLPFHADTLAMASQAICWLALGLALVALVRELGAREPYASSVAALVLATPTVRMQVGTGYVELVQLAFLFSGMALGMAFLRRPQNGLLVLTAAAVGLAAGGEIHRRADESSRSRRDLARGARAPRALVVDRRVVRDLLGQRRAVALERV